MSKSNVTFTGVIAQYAIYLMNCNLINSTGYTDFGNVKILEDAGFKHYVFEKDSFGPLSCGFKLHGGTLTYG
jgi:hypothetical protein